MAMVIGLVLVLGLAGFFFLDRAAKKPPPALVISTPCSPRLITSVRGPIA